MAAAITFLAGENFDLQATNGSGLGFYGASFGQAIRVGEYNQRTFITNAAGVSQGVEVDNIYRINSGSGVIGTAGSGVGLKNIPNYLGTLNIRFTYDTAVKVQSAVVRAYDRVNINNDPSGVSLYAAELIHPSTSQFVVGSGDGTWTQIYGSGSTLSLAPSPGVSGMYAGNGADGQWSDTQHDFYLALSASPLSVGSKTFALYTEIEYL